MQKTILITGATDGIGLETAKMLATQGHHVLIHGRDEAKLAEVAQTLSSLAGGVSIERYKADLSRMAEVAGLAKAVSEKHRALDALINNAGVFKAREAVTPDGLDARFAVNAIAPYLLTNRLLPRLGPSARIINLSSAAQSPVNLNALAGKAKLSDGDAYAQSKLALNMWTRQMAASLPNGPVVVAINPGSLLGSKMVKEAFGVAGKDLSIGAGILVRAALSDEFANASGKYFDNDSRRFASPHPDALDVQKSLAVVEGIQTALKAIGS